MSVTPPSSSWRDDSEDSDEGVTIILDSVDGPEPLLCVSEIELLESKDTDWPDSDVTNFLDSGDTDFLGSDDTELLDSGDTDFLGLDDIELLASEDTKFLDSEDAILLDD